MKKIDINTWKRKISYENFINYTNPIFSLSTKLDVTELYQYSKKNNSSFFINFMYIALQCLNSVEEMRLRIKNGEVVLFDEVSPNYIVLCDNNSIATCFTKLENDYVTFYNNARKDIDTTRKNGFHSNNFNSRNTNDCVYISSMHWVELTSVSNPYNLADSEGSSIPRLTWSKCVEENGRMKMTFDIAAHHALLDGEPVCRTFIKIQNALDKVEDMLLGEKLK